MVAKDCYYSLVFEYHVCADSTLGIGPKVLVIIIFGHYSSRVDVDEDEEMWNYQVVVTPYLLSRLEFISLIRPYSFPFPRARTPLAETIFIRWLHHSSILSIPQNCSNGHERAPSIFRLVIDVAITSRKDFWSLFDTTRQVCHSVLARVISGLVSVYLGCTWPRLAKVQGIACF